MRTEFANEHIGNNALIEIHEVPKFAVEALPGFMCFALFNVSWSVLGAVPHAEQFCVV
jgi:hypothetical protein